MKFLRQNQQVRHLIITKLHRTLTRNLADASTDDLHAEMIALKPFVVDQIYMFKKK